MIESAFKAFARALKDASRIDERNPDGVPSTKGTLTD
jgi:imidazoleglycerol phosphate dehydratase HisB